MLLRTATNVTVPPIAPQIDAFEDVERQERHASALTFLRGLFEPTDTICIWLIHQETKEQKWFIQSFEQATEPQTFDQLDQKQAEGWHVFVCMNALQPGSERRLKDNISEIRTAYLDIDKNGPEQLAELNKAVEAGEIAAPRFVVSSSPSKYHVSWRLNGATKEQQEALLVRLITRFGGDAAAKDCNRVLRLPGFKNLKYPEQPVALILKQSDSVATLDQFKIVGMVQAEKEFKIIDCTNDGPKIPYGQHDSTLTEICGKIHREQPEKNIDELTADLIEICEHRCVNHGSDYRQMCEKIARSIGSRIDKPDVLFGGKPSGATQPALSTDNNVVPAVSLWERATPFNQIDDAPMESIIPGMIAKGETTMLTGDFGSFKSYMTYFIADAVSEGGQFVRRTAQKHPVLVLDRENSKSTVSLRRYLVGNLRDKDNVRLLGRFTSPTAPEITNPELLELCRTIHPFVIIDSMQDFHAGKKENDVDDMTQFSLEVNGLVDAGAVAVLIIHHVPKAGRGKGAKYRGATAIPGGVGGALFVEKVGRFGVKIEGFKTRDGEDSVIELLLHFPSQSEMENKTGRVTYSITRSGLDRTAELRSSVLDYVRAASQRGESPSANEIAKSLGGDRNEIYTLVKSLKDEKQLVCTDEKKGRLGLPS